ncbi:ATP-binding protein [Candidatus Aerophobetes bacterium]|nr:ATP-binding protein [Candidatus Aerophobetes bacterium]
MNLPTFNHWWRKGEVNQVLKGKPRKILREILPYVQRRQIIILKGLRRVGKTTLLYQIIDHLLKKENVSPYRILYFSFDEEIENFDDITKTYQREVLREDLLDTKERCYLFFDEIQKYEGWPEKLKILYDLYPHLKIFASGSAALTLTRGVKESLAGRFFEFEIEPLDFVEYLAFRKCHYERERINIFKEDILREFDLFLCNSGYIEMMDENNPEIIRRYFQQSIMERVIYRDIPEQFTIRDPEILFRILKIVASQPGMLVEYKSFSSDLNRDQRTISNYFEYLKWSFLVRAVYLFSTNLLTSEKKLKKHYLACPAFSLALHGQLSDEFKSKLVENLFVSALKAKFFFRSLAKEEVDIILPVHRTLLPIEVKYRKRVKREDLSGLKSFMSRYKSDTGYLLSYDLEEEHTFSWGKISIVPAWKFLLFCEDYIQRVRS